MKDSIKAYCNLHPHEIISNFCAKEQCLQGLCANCICTHTESHIEKGSSPAYENIKITVKNLQQNLRDIMGTLNEDKDRIHKIVEKVYEKRQKVDEILSLAKKQTFEVLEKLFEEKGKKMKREIQNFQKQNQLHCQNRLDSLSNTISRQISTLISASEDLNSSSFLESIPRIKTQTFLNANTIHNQISFQILQNQSCNTNLAFNQNFAASLNDYVEKIVTMNFRTMDVKSDHRRGSCVLKRSQSFQNTKNLNIDFGMLKKSSQSQATRTQPTVRERPLSNFQCQSKGNHYLQQSRVQTSLKPNNFLLQIPQSRQIIKTQPLSTSNANNSLPINQGQKISVSKVHPHNFEYSSRDTIEGLSKKSKKSGLRVLQTYSNELDTSSQQIQQNNNSKVRISNFI